MVAATAALSDAECAAASTAAQLENGIAARAKIVQAQSRAEQKLATATADAGEANRTLLAALVPDLQCAAGKQLRAAEAARRLQWDAVERNIARQKAEEAAQFKVAKLRVGRMSALI